MCWALITAVKSLLAGSESWVHMNPFPNLAKIIPLSSKNCKNKIKCLTVENGRMLPLLSFFVDIYIFCIIFPSYLDTSENMNLIKLKKRVHNFICTHVPNSIFSNNCSKVQSHSMLLGIETRAGLQFHWYHCPWLLANLSWRNCFFVQTMPLLG